MNQIHHLLVLCEWSITFWCNFLSFTQPAFRAAVNSDLSVCFSSSRVLVFVAWPRCNLLILHISAPCYSLKFFLFMHNLCWVLPPQTRSGCLSCVNSFSHICCAYLAVRSSTVSPFENSALCLIFFLFLDRTVKVLICLYSLGSFQNM